MQKDFARVIKVRDLKTGTLSWNTPSCPQSWTLALQTQHCQALCSEAPISLPGGSQLQAATSSLTSPWPPGQEEKQEEGKTKETKQQDRHVQFLKCSPHPSKSPAGHREGGDFFIRHQKPPKYPPSSAVLSVQCAIPPGFCWWEDSPGAPGKKRKKMNSDEQRKKPEAQRLPAESQQETRLLSEQQATEVSTV